MLVTIKDNSGKLNELGKLMVSSGLPSLPDQFNVDDGVVERGRQQAMLDHPQLDNVAWQNLGIVFAARQYAADHPTMQAAPAQPIGKDDPIAAALHEALHGSPKPVYVDASDPQGAQVERSLAEAKKADDAVASMLQDIEKKKAEQQKHIDDARKNLPQAGPLLDQSGKPGYQEALEYVKSKGYDPPERVLEHVLVEQILASKKVAEAEEAAAAPDASDAADQAKAPDAVVDPVVEPAPPTQPGEESTDLDKQPPASDKVQ